MTVQIYDSLQVEEISLVDEGASGDGGQFRPLIHLKKRKKESPTMLDFSKIAADKRPTVKAGVQKLLRKALGGEEMEGPTLDAILEALPDDAMRSALIAMLEELKAPAPETEEKMDGDEDEEAAKSDEEEAEKSEDEEAAKAGEDEDEETPKAKSLEKRVESLQKTVAKLQREKRISKTRDDLQSMGTPGDLDALADAVLEVEDVCSKATAKAIKTMAKAFGALTKGGGTEPLGDAGSGETAGSASAELEKAVSKLRRDDPNLTEATAQRAAFRANPGLYERLRNEIDG